MDTRQIWQSQNFLKSPEFVLSLVEMTNIGKDDLVVEIGPGKGVITQQLARKAGRVIGVEIDKGLAGNLRSSFRNFPSVSIEEADFLKWQLPKEPYKVFANIPFNTTADIVNILLASGNPPEATYLIMQDKAAERFIGIPMGSNSQVSVLLQPFFEMGIVARIDRRQFNPVPNINAVLVEFTKREEPLVEVELRQQYRDFVIYGYNQWKPTVLDAFKAVFSDRQINLLATKFKIARLKPSELSVEQWVAMFNSFMGYVPEHKKNLVRGAEQNLKLKQKGMHKLYRTRSR